MSYFVRVGEVVRSYGGGLALYGSAEKIIRRNVVILRGFDQKIQSALADSLFVM